MMKKYFFLAALAALTLGSCQSSDEFEPQIPEVQVKGVPMSLTVSLGQNTTRVSYEYVESENIIKTAWTAGDKVSVVSYDENRRIKSVDTFEVTDISADGKSATFSGTFTGDNLSNANVFYPELIYDSENDLYATAFGSFRFNSDSDQSLGTILWMSANTDNVSALDDYNVMYGAVANTDGSHPEVALQQTVGVLRLDLDATVLPEDARIASVVFQLGNDLEDKIIPAFAIGAIGFNADMKDAAGKPYDNMVALYEDALSNAASSSIYTSFFDVTGSNGTAGTPVSSDGRFVCYIPFSPVLDEIPTGSFKIIAVLSTSDEYTVNYKGDTFPFSKMEVGKVYNIKGKLAIENVPFADDNFKEFCLQNFDTDRDGKISLEEAAQVTEIACTRKGITSLKGIEYFTALESLDCSYNLLTTLDVSKNTALKVLACTNNKLTSLDVSKNTALEVLNCANNTLLGTLDVSKNTALKNLDCTYISLTTLDISNNTALEALYCRANQLSSLDVSKNTALEILQCADNQLSSLDLSNNTALTELDCKTNKITSLDVSKHTALKNLDCMDNQLTKLDVSKNTALTSLTCSLNPLTTLDVSYNTALKDLSCHGNQLTTLDLSKNTAITHLNCGSNQFSSLDISMLTELWELDVRENTVPFTVYLAEGQSISNSRYDSKVTIVRK